jgi:hypothetical protein
MQRSLIGPFYIRQDMRRLRRRHALDDEGLPVRLIGSGLIRAVRHLAPQATGGSPLLGGELMARAELLHPVPATPCDFQSALGGH